jgi:hypothetical protein
MNRLEKLPVISWAVVHPRIAAWIVLATGMVVLLVIEAREVGLLPTQWLALIVACILVAGACVWIISWEGDDETDADVEEPALPAAPVTTVTTEEQETPAPMA